MSASEFDSIEVAPDTEKGYKKMIADVIRKGSYYQTLNESGKRIKEVQQSIVGELQGFTDRFVVFRKGNYFATYDENFKKIKEIQEGIVGVYKNATGQYMTFIKNGYIVTYDVMFKKVSERRA